MLILTYGTFDLFHYGHIRLLQRARSLGTRLAVGLSTDEFNAIKGKQAFMSYEERAELLMACRFVDEVFPERDWEQKALDIINLKAKIFVMGDDWKGKFDHLGHLCAVSYLERTPLISSTLLREGLKSSESGSSEEGATPSPGPMMPAVEKLDPPARNLADFERMIRSQAEPGGQLTRKAARIAYWITYPATLLECALMAVVSSIAYGLLRVFNLKFWHPEKARSRPRRMVKGVIDVENAIEAMQTIERIAQDSRAGIFWISGTLLGLERLAQPLPHDNDLDVGLHMDDPHGEDFLRALWASPDISEIAPQVLSWKTRIQNPDLHHIRGGIIRYKAAVRNPKDPHKPAVKLDIFLHIPYCGGSMHGTRNSIWWNTTPAIANRSYNNRQFSVPEDTPLYLTENYGNYRNEVKDFENSVDCPNVMNIFSWRSLGTLISRQQMMLKLGRLDRARQINKRIMATVLKGMIPFPKRPPMSDDSISADRAGHPLADMETIIATG